MDPFVDNPEVERDRVTAEGIEQALVQSIQNQASQGAIPPLVLAKIMRLVRTDKMELAEAFAKVTEDAAEEAQREQEAEGRPSAEAMMAPAAMSAMAGPEAAAQIPGANQTQESLGNMLNTLRKGVRDPGMGRATV
jgi:hypothetical protein